MLSRVLPGMFNFILLRTRINLVQYIECNPKLAQGHSGVVNVFSLQHSIFSEMKYAKQRRYVISSIF